MSRIDELKKQYPELNLTMFDLFKRIDTTTTYKYFPLLCKLLGKRFNLSEQRNNSKEEIMNEVLELHSILLDRGVSTDNLTNNELYTLYHHSDYFDSNTLYTIKDFIRYMDKNQIENKDVTSYSDIEEVRVAVMLASTKELSKELEGQVIKEYEDDKWLIVRPLTFHASAKYGASTRWCTTYKKDKQYFEKYWQNGILVYFINKQSGYKFAGFKGIYRDIEVSFWNSEDNRVDFFQVEADDYLFSIVRNILKSTNSNKELCSKEIQDQVSKECRYNREESRLIGRDGPTVEINDSELVDPEPVADQAPAIRVFPYLGILRD
jgi:hypothetical protein